MDKSLDTMLAKLVEEIERIESTRNRFGSVLRELKQSIDLSKFPAITASIAEPEFSKTIAPVDLSGLRIAGIDGGLVRKRFRSMDLVLTRGIAVIFHFGPKEGLHVDFFPKAFPEPNITPVMLTLPGPELDQLASLERMAAELRITIAVLDKFETDLILVDGSLFYHPRDRPQTGSIVYAKFQEVAALYKQLYSKAMKKNTILVGIIKDSRSTRIVSLLGDLLPHLLRNPTTFEKMQGVDYRWLLRISRDCDLLDAFLDTGERTFAFKYSTELDQNSKTLSNDLSEWASSIWITYLRTAADDLPLRIEVLAGSNDPIGRIDKALSAIFPLSWQHLEYGIPTPILEADARAKISMNEAQLIIDRLMALSGLTYTTLEKRRSRNPFGGA
ncbi:MAG: DNA double-strand break repair nuclease NurA [Candidatus Thorarchaeota archaeon]|nr:DNA double-strand break repair nuclease NurA [Candidatus Thorarchaeota archaeon]